jgi:membrane glycosyltransferase
MPDGAAMRRLLDDPMLLAAHRAMLPPPRRPGQDPFEPLLALGLAKLDEASDLDQALSLMTLPERAAVLGNPAGLARLVALRQSAAIQAIPSPLP